MPAITVDDILVLPRVPERGLAETERKVTSVTTAPSGYEGEGFPVRRAFAGVDLARLDPFVHMDQMGEVDYGPGEPKGTAWHPHRGFETVTYIIDGTFRHQDSNGGGGLITNGDTQWMTAGGGILHIEEPPEELVMSGGLFHGFQLWVNLPARLKLTQPRYQDIRAGQVALLLRLGQHRHHPGHVEVEQEQRRRGRLRHRHHLLQRRQGLRADRELGHRLIGVRPWRIRPSDSHSRGRQQQHATDGLLAQNFRESLGLRPGAPRQQATP